VDAARKALAGADAEPAARTIVEALATAMQASLMKRHSDANAAEAFCASRTRAPAGARNFGTLPGNLNAAAIVDRAALEA
jgi:putative acyl-CoA dehydrogenase